jgi:hypothetical protein
MPPCRGLERQRHMREHVARFDSMINVRTLTDRHPTRTGRVDMTSNDMNRLQLVW